MLIRLLLACVFGGLAYLSWQSDLFLVATTLVAFAIVCLVVDITYRYKPRRQHWRFRTNANVWDRVMYSLMWSWFALIIVVDVINWPLLAIDNDYFVKMLPFLALVLLFAIIIFYLLKGIPLFLEPYVVSRDYLNQWMVLHDEEIVGFYSREKLSEPMEAQQLLVATTKRLVQFTYNNGVWIEGKTVLYSDVQFLMLTGYIQQTSITFGFTTGAVIEFHVPTVNRKHPDYRRLTLQYHGTMKEMLSHLDRVLLQK